MADKDELLTRARMAALVRSAEDAIVATDGEGTITDWNPAAERLFGYGEAEAVGRSLCILVAAADAAVLSEHIRSVRQGIAARAQFPALRKNGAALDVSLTLSPIRDPAGAVLGVSAILRDVTHERRERLHEGLLAAIVDSSHDAIISKDMQGVVTSWNPGAEALFGYAAEEIIGRNISTIAVPGREAEMDRVLERIRRGERIDHHDTQRLHKDGSIIDLSLGVSPVFDADGTIIGASKIARDIGERTRGEQRLRLLMNELDHRAKNVLAVAQAILRLTRAENLPDFVSAVEGRIKALARVHTQVAENRWDGAELRKLALTTLEVFGDETRVTVEGPRIWVSPAAAQVLGVLLHELATNATKHGALSGDRGRVALSWGLQPAGDLRVTWTESNGPPVTLPTRRSFGTQVIERNIPDQLGGKATMQWQAAGLECEFIVPAAFVVRGPSPLQTGITSA